MDCIEIKKLLGKKADDEQELLELIEEVPLDSIYYHTHSYFLRHYYIAGAYPNDFDDWAAIQVRDRDHSPGTALWSFKKHLEYRIISQ